MKKDLGKKTLEKEAALWERIKKINPGKVCRK
jgi:hypothetical protein